MADTKISADPSASALAGTETLPLLQGGANKKVLLSVIATYINSLVSVAFSSLTGKPTTLSGYGITDAQPLDTQLTSLAGLSYSGNSLKVVRVNSGETGFEVATPASGGASVPTIVQSSASVGDTSALTLTSTPTSGNILIAMGNHWTNNATVGAGWTAFLNTNGASTDGLWGAWRICDGTESTSQTPFSTAGGSGNVIWEIAGLGASPFLNYQFQESTSAALSMIGLPSTKGLILGFFCVQASSFDFTLGGSATLDQNVTGTTSNNSPRRIKSFHFSGASGVSKPTATLDAGHSTSGVLLFLPG